jgi:hypothetical protein
VGSQAGLLLERFEVPAARREAWQEHDERQAKLLAEQAGVTEVRRYTRVEEPGQYLTTCDLRSLEALPRALAPAAGGEQPDQRVYRRIPGPAPSKDTDDSICGGAIVGMWWTPAPGGETELTAWYDEEHTPMLMAIPGWLRVRRYALVDGGGPAFLAIHDLASKDVFDHPLHREAQATRTPWWNRLRATRLDSELTIWELSDRFLSGAAA